MNKIYLKDIKDRFPEFEFKNYNPDAYFTSFSHDSRDMQKDSLYIPIIGDKFDGHEFIKASLDNGASVSLCENSKTNHLTDVNKPIILVDSIQEGLQKVLNYYIGNISKPIVAITGSTGKTTTRRMLTHILEKEKKVLSSDNTNTVWGNAELLACYKDEDVIVLECAMDSKGEIAWHCNSTDPDIGILLNIGYVHAGKLGGIEEVYKEKKDLADYMEKTGKPLILNIDDEYLSKIPVHYNKLCPLYTFGQSDKAEYKIKNILVDEQGTHYSFVNEGKQYDVNLSVYGEGYVYDSIAAIIAAKLLGIEISSSIKYISTFTGQLGRFEKIEINNNLLIINDAYNANPDSMKMSITSFSRLYENDSYHTIVILGDMSELGDVSEQLHKELGKNVSKHSFNEVYYIGNSFNEFNYGKHVSSVDEMTSILETRLKELKDQKVAILIKASHSVGLYILPDYLCKLNII
ncbi:UDP-N-acetylmuramoyl-tripeptide--D-alanyl-D-alanine ligase [bacterium]|nr:UDP-N-acetylmuramoyl-tripeptide--D-alanyl-D-alanine ligase [bacterium]